LNESKYAFLDAHLFHLSMFYISFIW